MAKIVEPAVAIFSARPGDEKQKQIEVDPVRGVTFTFKEGDEEDGPSFQIIAEAGGTIRVILNPTNAGTSMRIQPIGDNSIRIGVEGKL